MLMLITGTEVGGLHGKKPCMAAGRRAHLHEAYTKEGGWGESVACYNDSNYLWSHINMSLLTV